MGKVIEYYISELKADILLNSEYNKDTGVWSVNVSDIHSEYFTPDQIAFYAEEILEEVMSSNKI